MNRFLRLSPHCSLKRLEKPYIYDIKNDELYEIDDKAEEFIKSCDGTSSFSIKGQDREFIDLCIKENLLQIS